MLRMPIHRRPWSNWNSVCLTGGSLALSDGSMRACFACCLTFVSVVVLCLPAAGAGASEGEAADWLRWHFLGTTRIAADTNGVRAQVVFGQPSTRALMERALAGLARSASHDAAGAALVRSVLEEWQHAESYGAVRGDPGTPEHQWLLAVRLGAGRAAEWAAKWGAFGEATGFAGARSEVKDDWFIGGLKPGQPADLAPMQERIAGPEPADGASAWIEIHADLGQLARRFGWAATIAWPRAHVTVAGRGLNVRTSAEFSFAAPLNLPLTDWDIPTNTVREPLLSFTAVQGIQPWWSARTNLQALGWPPANQVFYWAQSLAPYTTHLAWRMPKAATRIPAARDVLKPVVCALAPWMNVGTVELEAETHRLNWHGLPILVPFVAPAEDDGFVFAGIFPVANPRGPAPPELYAQLSGRTNLVYYDWELTQPRLGDWQSLDMMYRMIGLYTPAPSNSLARAWLSDTNVTSQLGNCVTELTVTSPTELRAVRNSAAGFTAFELFRAALWIEGDNFPQHTPPPPLQFQRPRRTSPNTRAPAAKP